MRLIDAPIGLFMSKEGEMCLKTEYIADWGVEAYIVSSGETFWGGAKTAEERNNLDVTPVDAVPVVYGRNVKPKECTALFECSVCGWECWDTMSSDTEIWNYCPNCGSKMLKEQQ